MREVKGVSILIKIPMPKNCAECPCLRHDSIDGVNAYQCNITFGIRKNIDRKPKWCPLVDLGEHGRLIDADKLMDDIKKNSASYFADDFAREWVDVQPTAIEAEE
jgi:hypothetical protein